MLASVPLADWKAYLKWHLLDTSAPSLSSAFVNEDFRFSSTLSGAKEMLPRDKRCARATDVGLRDALGQADAGQPRSECGQPQGREAEHERAANCFALAVGQRIKMMLSHEAPHP